jgi:hypothetical protein
MVQTVRVTVQSCKWEVVLEFFISNYLRVARRIRPAMRRVPTAATPPASAIPTYPSAHPDQ